MMVEVTKRPDRRSPSHAVYRRLAACFPAPDPISQRSDSSSSSKTSCVTDSPILRGLGQRGIIRAKSIDVLTTPSYNADWIGFSIMG